MFFQTLYPENRAVSDQAVMEEFLKRFQKLGFGGSAPPPPPAIDSQELERLIQSAVRTALSEREATDPETPPDQPEDDGRTSPERGKPRRRKRSQESET